MVWGFALTDSFLGLFWLRRMLTGATDSKTVIMLIGLIWRILGLGAISFYAFRTTRPSKANKLAGFICIYVLIGLTTGLSLFAARMIAFTLYISSQNKAILLDYFTLRGVLALSGFCIGVCTLTGLITRAYYADRERRKDAIVC
jgi:hypothetical protein